MASQNQGNLDSEAIAEVVFFLILVWMIAGPVRGTVLSTQTWISSVFTKGATQVESTKNLAEKLIESSERIKALEEKLAKSELELTKYKQQSRDTNKLRLLLGLREKADRKTIAADVIARNPDNWFEQITVDKGTHEGITEGSAVITSDGVVGQVVKVSEHASVVKLLTDPDMKLGVVLKKTGVTGILSGNFQKQAKIDWVPVGTNVDVGEKVSCLGKGGTFPENHPVGTVVGVRRDTNGASMQIEVKLSENCYDLSQVLILPPLGM